MSHPIIDDKPEMIAFAKQRAKAQADADAWQETNAKAQKAYEAASLAALEGGTRIPEAPQHPNAWRSVFDGRMSQIRNEESAWKADHADELAAEVLEREDKIIARVSKMLDELDGYVVEVGALRGALTGLHTAKGGTGMLPSAGVSLELLLGSARRDSRMLREPFTPQRPSIDKLDPRRPAPERRGASITSGAPGMTESAWQR